MRGIEIGWWGLGYIVLENLKKDVYLVDNFSYYYYKIMSKMVEEMLKLFKRKICFKVIFLYV